MIELLTAFGGGVLASLTPCVYPMIPITVGFIAGRSKTRFQAFLLSLVYVLGMSLTYSTIGIFAALTGKVFGKITMVGPVYFMVGSIILFFGLVQLGVISFKIPQSYLGSLGGGTSKEGTGGALLMGLTSGFVAAPCTAPILGSILAYIASHQNMVFGMALMFSFSLGLGLLFIVLGCFTGFLTSLPKSGTWLITIEKISGVFLLIIGGYFILKVFIRT